jgi:hypothetical protein
MSEGMSMDRLNELRNMVQQASARLDALALEASSNRMGPAQIDQLKSRIKQAQDILTAQKQKLSGQMGGGVVGTVPWIPTTYLVGELAITVIPNAVGSGEDLPPGGPPDPPGTPGPSGSSYLDIGDPYVQLEIDTAEALLMQTSIASGVAPITATLPNSLAEVEALQTKLTSAQETLDEMRMLSG